jgi:hypothetical protein
VRGRVKVPRGTGGRNGNRSLCGACCNHSEPWCGSSNRVGVAWAIVQARRGKSLDAVLAAGREAGLKGATMEDAVRRLAAPKTP